jgi:hypothetical protein
VAVGELQHQGLVQRLDEAHVGHGEAELAPDLLGGGTRAAEGEQRASWPWQAQLALADGEGAGALVDLDPGAGAAGVADHGGAGVAVGGVAAAGGIPARPPGRR